MVQTHLGTQDAKVIKGVSFFFFYKKGVLTILLPMFHDMNACQNHNREVQSTPYKPHINKVLISYNSRFMILKIDVKKILLKTNKDPLKNLFSSQNMSQP